MSCTLRTSKQPEAAVAVLHNDVLPFYRERALPITAVLTDNGREFCGTDSHPYEVYLALNDLEHRRTRVRRPQTNGFVERFHRTVLDEFCRSAFRTTFYETVEALQRDLDAWLVHYNTELRITAIATWASAPSRSSMPTWKLFTKKPSSTSPARMLPPAPTLTVFGTTASR